ncbi:hypothetical protein [Chitinimonas lacunae]|uniref:Uncharacterized protein n=1 Tax=Chitinimonas lacunae TaxID=1963018 RepID=A0ABV8MM64_9NEIS
MFNPNRFGRTMLRYERLFWWSMVVALCLPCVAAMIYFSYFRPDREAVLRAFGICAMFLLILGLLWAQRRRHRLELEAIDGFYFEWNRHQLRAFVDANETLWLCLEDIGQSLGRSPREIRLMRLDLDHSCLCIGPTGLHLINHAGAKRLLERRSGREMARLARYLLHDVFEVYEKRREMRTGSLTSRSGSSGR